MKILFVDDGPMVLAAFRRSLRYQVEFDTVVERAEVLALKEHTRYAVVVADMTMPRMRGVVLLEKVRQLFPETVRVMLTGNADQVTAVDAVNRGQVFRFIHKPCPAESLLPILREALTHHQVLSAEHELLENTLFGIMRVMSEIL
ncbi:MAG: response regulator [Candidatus Synoicihabitans palmerolidicus]|nr:response regulator [Candidatus Synoicihabitans palmerolidicus]